MPAGAEVFKCQNFGNPFGVDVDVLRTESRMAEGSHHLVVFFEGSASDGSVYDCSGLEFGERIHGAQTPEHVREYPEGVGIRMYAAEGLRFNMHYLNPTSQPITAKASLTILAASAGTAQYLAGFLFMNNTNISVAPHSQGTATKSCSLPADINVISLLGHMHMHATHITAQTGSGKVIYENNDWDHPTEQTFNPPLGLGDDTEITWTCSYDNTTDIVLGFGESAQTNEMCILGGSFYPARSRSYGCLL